jgi:hypothetical protein
MTEKEVFLPAGPLDGGFVKQADGRWWKHGDKRKVHISYVSVEDALETIRKAAEGLEGAALEINVSPIGSIESLVVGDRPATDEEIAAIEQQRERRVLKVAKIEQQDTLKEDAEVKEFILQHPDLDVIPKSEETKQLEED